MVDETMATTPEAKEVIENLNQMKESAPGPDEITVKMLRHGGPILRKKVVEIIQRMWDSDPEEWERIMHEARKPTAIHQIGRKNLTQRDRMRGIVKMQWPRTPRYHRAMGKCRTCSSSSQKHKTMPEIAFETQAQ